jgi:hypothetical protein
MSFHGPPQATADSYISDLDSHLGKEKVVEHKKPVRMDR